jgi:hypothetical protein
MKDLTIGEHRKLMEKVSELKQSHRDLDTAILRLQSDLHPDQLQVRRLKKHKLRLKDNIAKLESNLIPDELA